MADLLRRALPLPVLAGALLLGGGPADAARFTSHLDDLEGEVIARDEALTGTLDRAQKKAKAAYGKSRAALAGDTLDLADELKLAAKVATTLEKGVPGDGELADLLGEAADFLAADAADLLGGLDTEVSDDPDSRGKEKALRAIDAAGNYLDLAGGEDLASLRLKLMGKAVKKTVPVDRYLTGGGGGGGGGNTNCSYNLRSLGAGEHSTASWDGGSFTAGAVRVDIMDFGESLRVGLATFSCAPTLTQMMSISMFDTPPVNTAIPYDGNTGLVIVSSGSGDPEGILQTSSGSGTITFTVADPATGTYQGTYTYLRSGGGMTVENGSFRIVGAK